jgi:hypothetical protein
VCSAQCTVQGSNCDGGVHALSSYSCATSTNPLYSTKLVVAALPRVPSTGTLSCFEACREEPPVPRNPQPAFPSTPPALTPVAVAVDQISCLFLPQWLATLSAVRQPSTTPLIEPPGLRRRRGPFHRITGVSAFSMSGAPTASIPALAVLSPYKYGGRHCAPVRS